LYFSLCIIKRFKFFTTKVAETVLLVASCEIFQIRRCTPAAPAVPAAACVLSFKTKAYRKIGVLYLRCTLLQLELFACLSRRRLRAEKRLVARAIVSNQAKALRLPPAAHAGSSSREKMSRSDTIILTDLGLSSTAQAAQAIKAPLRPVLVHERARLRWQIPAIITATPTKICGILASTVTLIDEALAKLHPTSRVITPGSISCPIG
jgi:hypothetical protein